VPIYELGKASGRMLINLIEGNPIESNPEILDANLIVRESCGSHLSK
jgi:DNA-binding LacI/PurR family transcriptional regulator